MKKNLGVLLKVSLTAVFLSANIYLLTNYYPKTEIASAASATTFNIKDFGAKGDCSTDDTAAIQSAINAAVSAGGSTVFIPAVPNCYKVTSGITINGRVSIIGEGWEAKNITASGGSALRSSVASGDLFVINSASPILFRDFAIGSLYGGKGGGAAIHFTCSNCGGYPNYGSMIDHVGITDYKTGISIENTAALTVKNSMIGNNYQTGAVAIWVSNVANPNHGEFNFINNTFNLGPNCYGVYYLSGGDMRFVGNKVLGGLIGFKLTSQGGVPFRSGNLVISGSSFDGQGQFGIQATNANGNDVFTNIAITGNVFFGNGGGLKYISLGGSSPDVYQNITINANSIRTLGGTTGIEIFHARNVNLIGNTLQSEGGGTAMSCQGTVNPMQGGNVFSGWNHNSSGC